MPAAEDDRQNERSRPVPATGELWPRAWEYAAALASVLLLWPALVAAAHWPFVHDAPVIRYMGFLMENGFAPYRDIIDMQMPGTYLADRLVVHALGSGATAWFAWEVLNGILLTLSAVWIAGRGRRPSGLIAGILACLAHLSDGPWVLGQRDWTVAMLMMMSAGCLFQFVRGGRNAWIGCAFLLGGLAATIKPPALLLPMVLFAAIAFHRKKAGDVSRTVILRLLGWAVAGILPSLLLIVVFLHRWHALRDFLAIFGGLIPYYASLHHPTLLLLIKTARLPILLLLIATLYSVRNRSWRSLEINLLMLASACGLALYILQDKGFPYHLYTAVAFLFLWVILEMSPRTEDRPQPLEAPAIGRSRASGPGLLVFVSLIGLLCLSAVLARRYPMNTLDHLESDLTQLGGAELDHHVQCLDMTLASCVNVLYRMRLVQSTGTISDFYLFADRPTPLTRSLSDAFLKQVTATPPRVFVLSSQMWPSDRDGYSELANFPQFQTLLRQNYTLAREYHKAPEDAAGYRIYLHK